MNAETRLRGAPAALMYEHPGEIKAQIVEDNGRVVMRKTCPKHGEFEDVMSTDPAFLERAVAAAQAQAAARPITPNPSASPAASLPSLNRAGQHASTSAADLEANMTDDDLYASITQPRDARGRFSAAT